ncbi:MAG TPA: hypothetical protein VE890_10460, partial [Thermoguttaceae bacterium]|nr:hypothetical protein [Thermoguttaceae bacterium]
MIAYSPFDCYTFVPWSVMLLRMLPYYCVSLLILLTPAARFAQAEPPPPLEKVVARSTNESAGFRDDPLGHVPPAVGGRLEQSIRETAADDQAEHHGLFGTRFHGSGPVAIESIYVGEVFTNTHGGRTTDHATRYEGLLDLA